MTVSIIAQHTPWYSGNSLPHHEGVYQRAIGTELAWSLFVDGVWCAPAGSPAEAKDRTYPDLMQHRPWRGLTIRVPAASWYEPVIGGALVHLPDRIAPNRSLRAQGVQPFKPHISRGAIGWVCSLEGVGVVTGSTPQSAYGNWVKRWQPHLCGKDSK